MYTRRKIVKRALALALGTAVLAVSLPDAAHASDGEQHIKVQVVRMAVQDAPLPTEARAVGLLQAANTYWSTLSGGKLTLEQDGPALTAYTSNSNCWCEWPGSGQSDLPPKSGDDVVRMVVTEHIGIATGSAGGALVALLRRATTETSSHEFGHIFGLGHAAGFSGDGDPLAYLNPWSIMGSGSGAPEGAHLQQLGLSTVRNVSTAPGTQTIYLNPMGTPDRNTFTWLSPGGVRYFMEYRSPVGMDSGVFSGPRVTVYTYDGHETHLYEEIRLGQHLKFGGRWVGFVGSVPTKAKVLVY